MRIRAVLAVLAATCGIDATIAPAAGVAMRAISVQGPSVSYEISWTAPSVVQGQAPITGYRTYVLRGDPAVAADTVVLGTTGLQLKDTLTFAHGDSVNSNLRGMVRSVDTRGRASGISTSPPFTFDPFPLPPSPPSAISVRML